jgi:glycosyltransferase involved in cell wall biosynthesis
MKSGEVFTTGQMGEAYFNRFRACFECVTVIGLCEDEKQSNIGKIVESVDLNSTFVKYVFIQSSGSIFGRYDANRNIIKQYIQLIGLHDRVATKAPSLILGFVVRLSKKYRMPVLIEVVGCPWDTLWNHSMKGKLVAPFLRGITRKAIKNAPYVLYVTNEFLQARYPCKNKTIGCSDVALPPLDEYVLERRLYKIYHRDSEKAIILGTAAAVNVKYKGQEYVIKAISRLNREGFNFEYHLAGGGNNSYLRAIAEKYGILDKVKFLGAIPHEKIFQYFDSIDVYIQPSKTEGLPRALIEAMSRGCPALGSNAGGIPELINKNFVFKKSSVDGVYELLNNMDTEIMSKEAKRSFDKGKEYTTKILDSKRRDFYDEFITVGTVNSRKTTYGEY